MKITHSIILLFALISSSCAFAQTPFTCSTSYFSSLSDTAQKLRDTAAKCSNQQLSRLYYNRAYHHELMTERRSLAKLLTKNAENREDHQITGDLLYIALVEAFAPHRYKNENKRVDFLNKVYEQRSEIMELRLRGYDKRAELLEKKKLF